MPFGVEVFFTCQASPEFKSCRDNFFETSGGCVDVIIHSLLAISKGDFKGSNSCCECFFHLVGESCEHSIKFISGSIVGCISIGKFFLDSCVEGLKFLNNESFEIVLLLRDILFDLVIVTIVSTVMVSLGVSKSPDEFLNVPEDLFTEFINSSLVHSSVCFNLCHGGIFSVQKFSSKSFDSCVEGIHGVHKSAAEGCFKSFSGINDFLFNFNLVGINVVLLFHSSFWDSLHDVLGGVLNKSLNVGDVLNVELLLVFKNSLVLLNSNSLLEATVSVAGALSP